MKRENYFDELNSIKNENDFLKLTLDVFQLQAEKNIAYKEFIKNLKINPSTVQSIDQIPFLPVEIFKTQSVLTGDHTYEIEFSSSGTTGSEVSRHFVKDLLLYEKVFSEIFCRNYGDPSEYVFLALLPSYLERGGSSLIYMMKKLIDISMHKESGFYLEDMDKLHATLVRLKMQNQKTILFGVTFALLDFAASHSLNFPELIIMETGGMKGRRKEMVREEVHQILCRAFAVKQIHSEYGMTELLSQAYSGGNGIFKTPPWMRILIRDAYDPLIYAKEGTTGGINIIDLANIDSCAFLSTQDLGRMVENGAFEVLGRFDYSDVRGCNLLVD